MPVSITLRITGRHAEHSQTDQPFTFRPEKGWVDGAFLAQIRPILAWPSQTTGRRGAWTVLETCVELPRSASEGAGMLAISLTVRDDTN